MRLTTLLREANERVGRGYADTTDALDQCMTLPDHHSWPKDAANKLRLSSDHLWQALCAAYASGVGDDNEARAIVQHIKDELDIDQAGRN